MLEKGIERTLLTDFGLARTSDDASLTCTGFHPGTPQYMSPEQARGDAVDTRSDLFSLGSVIYAMCAGRPPFRAETAYGVLRRITDNEPRAIREINPDIPRWLERIVSKLHAKAVEHRYGTASEVRDLLEQCLAHIQQPTTTALPANCLQGSQDPRWPVAVGRWALGLLAILALAVVIGLATKDNMRELLTGAASSNASGQDESQKDHSPIAEPPSSASIAGGQTDDSKNWIGPEDQLEKWSADWQRFESDSSQFWSAP